MEEESRVDRSAVARLPVVGVMGSGSATHEERSVPLGRRLAELGVHLLTGGGAGVMAAVSKAFHETPGRRGLVIGVIPGTPPPGYPNPWVELAIRTHLPLSGERGQEPMSRNHLNVLSSDVIVALPGSAGTASEVTLAVRYGRPIIAWVGSREEIPGLPEEVPVAADLGDVEALVQGVVGCLP